MKSWRWLRYQAARPFHWYAIRNGSCPQNLWWVYDIALWINGESKVSSKGWLGFRDHHDPEAPSDAELLTDVLAGPRP